MFAKYSPVIRLRRFLSSGGDPSSESAIYGCLQTTAEDQQQGVAPMNGQISLVINPEEAPPVCTASTGDS
jgi:hypothetical protein